MKDKKNNLEIFPKGFTLVEIMVAIGIVSILAAVVLVSMQGYGAKARAARALAQASSVISPMVSCNGNGGTPQFGASGTDLCTGITNASNYGKWPTFPEGYGLNENEWNSVGSWHFSITGESQIICCNSKMNSCGIITGTCQGAEWH
jgi:prepilin-type N-terminal cleavage/methylation domain-containing protein